MASRPLTSLHVKAIVERVIEDSIPRLTRALSEAVSVSTVVAHGNPSSMLSRKEVAQKLGLSLPTIARLISSGQIKTVRVGRRVLISEADVALFLAVSKGQS